MPQQPELTFWFEFASTYSYPAAMRIEQQAASAGVRIVWRPFLLGPLFASQGMTDSPFNLYPVKGAYMWRDLARLCAELDLPLRQPSVFPRHSLRAARLATAAFAAGMDWAPGLVRGIYRANFAEDRDIADPAVLAALLAELGADPAEWLARTEQAGCKAALRQATETAASLGLFGAPSFTFVGPGRTGGAAVELFWGNDRLEQALRWAQGKHALVSPPRQAPL